MTRPVSDNEIEAAFTAWAQDAVAATTERQFSVTGANREGQLPRRRHTRAVLPVLAAAGVAVLVAAGLLVRNLNEHQKASPTATTTHCPNRLPGVAATAPRRAEPLFRHPVSDMVACSYAGPRRTQLVAAVPLTRPLAGALAQHLNDAPTTKDDPDYFLAALSISVLLARDANGHPLAAVTLIPGCRQIGASNGHTTRYLNTADPALRQAEQYLESHK